MKLNRCSCKRYTLKKKCPICSKPTHSPHPARFSPIDKYAKYRLEAQRRAGII